MALRLKRNAPSGEADEASPDCATRFGFRASPYRIVKQQMMFLPLHISVGSPLPAPCSPPAQKHLLPLVIRRLKGIRLVDSSGRPGI